MLVPHNLRPDGTTKFDDLRRRLASARVGFSGQEEAGEQLERVLRARTGVDIEPCLYEATQTMVKALNDGTIQLAFCLLSEIINSERLRKLCSIYAVAGEDRNRDLPDIPTLQEFGIDLVCGEWVALALPAGAQKEYVERVWNILSDQAHFESLRAALREYGGMEHVRGPEAFGQFLGDQARILNEIDGQRSYTTEEDHSSLYRAIGGIGLFAAFVVVGPLIGYLPSSLGFLVILIVVLWPRRIGRALPLLIVLAVGVSLGIYWIFSSAFSVVFP
jgi:hypothetical protein